jgi:hypothetical protein
MPPTEDEIRALVEAATDATEELYIASMYTRRPAVRQRFDALIHALVPFAAYSRFAYEDDGDSDESDDNG